MLRRCVLTLLAHPDDAEILCAGTLTRLAGLGWEVHIATATAGDCGTATQSAAEISRIRLDEAQSAAGLIGANYHCLGMLDGRVCYDVGSLGMCFDLLRRVNPSLVLTHPRRDYMMDHEVVHQLARAASFVFAARNVSDTPLPIGAVVPHLYYTDPIGGVDELGWEIVPGTLVDISGAAQQAKLRMLACHASQREWLRHHHGMDEYVEATRRRDAGRGRLLGVAAAEGFVQHRGHAYPGDDLLGELFSLAKER